MIALSVLGILIHEIVWITIIGCLGAFLMSQPRQIVTAKNLAIAIFVFFFASDVLLYLIVAPLDLVITTNNLALQHLIKTRDVTSMLIRHFQVLDWLVYAIETAFGTWIGLLIVRKRNERQD